MLPVSGFKIKSLRRTLRCDNLVNLNSVILIRYLGILQVGLYSYPHTQVAPIGSNYHLTKDIIGNIMKTRRLIIPYINISRKNIRGLSCDLFDYECQNVNKKNPSKPHYILGYHLNFQCMFELIYNMNELGKTWLILRIRSHL